MKNALLLLLPLIVIGYLILAPKPPQNIDDEQVTLLDLPWQVEIDADNNSTIFGQTLKKSSLAQFMGKFTREPEIKLFRNSDGSLSLEAFFENVSLAHIISKVVVKLEMSEKSLKQLESNAAGRKATASGAYELGLSEQDQKTAQNAIIHSITWSPTWLKITDDELEARFGKPVRKISLDNGNQHWLYPDIGVDIVRNEDKKSVIQYVPLEEFESRFSELIAQPSTEQKKAGE